ncbi:hypothetical protein BSKO_06092 [Bryopsis sp. KO-2023]|nr:hypothetical protein BSKO_06092 [Bryopsis sp. KO-2023]
MIERSQRSLFWMLGAGSALAAYGIYKLVWHYVSHGQCHRMDKVVDGVLGAIGNTPLIRIASLSEATGCEILGKAEFLNPGGSVKDRVAKELVEEGMKSGALDIGGLITEGTVGSTGVSLVMVAKAVGCRCHIVMPDDAAIEKAQTLEALDAVVERVRPVSIVHPDHFVNVARRRANEESKNGPHGAMFADQFENLANFRAHLKTGAEMWSQTNGKMDAFVSGAGTGGTIAGVSNYLKGKSERVKIFLSDPPGSSLYNKVTRGVMYDSVEAEGKRLRNPFDTITEGVGINRTTQNFSLAKIDGAFKCSDREAVEMSKHLVRNDGLFLGSSTAVNCVGAVKVAKSLGPGHVIVTILCDGGARHLSKFHNPEYLEGAGLAPRGEGGSLDFIQMD